MKYLYIDTSSSFLYTGIVEKNKILAEVKEVYGQSVSDISVPILACGGPATKLHG